MDSKKCSKSSFICIFIWRQIELNSVSSCKNTIWFLKKGKKYFSAYTVDVIVSYWLCVNCRWAGADFIDVLQWDEELRVQWGGTELNEEGRHQHTEEHAIHGPPIPLIQRHLRRVWGHQQGHRVSSRSLTKVRS